MIPGLSQIRWLFGYGLFAIAGGFLSVRIFELMASPFLEAASLTQRAQQSLSLRLREFLSDRD